MTLSLTIDDVAATVQEEPKISLFDNLILMMQAMIDARKLIHPKDEDDDDTDSLTDFVIQTSGVTYLSKILPTFIAHEEVDETREPTYERNDTEELEDLPMEA